ncbi:MAG: efflux RND transporter periplasmic adaptor subunit [Akkermansiaceae bacterium]|nr:efflux RND transporter periplasmic adaptor subunit [Akkermansiaceae bacterium]
MNSIFLKTRSLFFCGLTLSWLTSCEEKAPPAQMPPLPVTVAKAELAKALVYDEFPATLRASSQIEIRARVKGVLLKKHFSDGQRVQKGELLYEIEPDPYRQSMLAAEADLTRAKAGRNLAQTRFDRLSLALEKNATSKIDVDVAAAELAQSAAAVQQAEAQLKSSELNLGYTKIFAPITGRLSRSLVDEGNLVGFADPTLLTTIIDDSEIQVYFEVPERKVLDFLAARNDEGSAKRVKALEVRLKLADGRIFAGPGEIDFIDNEVSSKTRTNKVRAMFPNPDGVLASGLYGLVGVPRPPDSSKPGVEEALILPTEATLRDLAGSFVWVVDDKNTVQRRTVVIGKSLPLEQSNGVNKSVILSGLDGTENVIVAGLQRAREGAVVNAQPAGK